MAAGSAERRIRHTASVRAAFSRTRQSCCCILTPFCLPDGLAAADGEQISSLDLHAREGRGPAQAQEGLGVDDVSVLQVPDREVLAQGQAEPGPGG